MDLMSHKKYNMHFHVLKNIHLMAVNSHISCLFYLLHPKNRKNQNHIQYKYIYYETLTSG